MSQNERVNHPTYYSHPSGYECIDVIRHYVCDIAMALKYIWRAGRKTEEGISDKDKEIEDVRKAIFYIDDYRRQLKDNRRYYPFPVGYRPVIEEITDTYTASVADAMRNLAYVGCVIGGRVTRTIIDEERLDTAKGCLLKRIEELSAQQ